jgi:hypothetical protein
MLGPYLNRPIPVIRNSQFNSFAAFIEPDSAFTDDDSTWGGIWRMQLGIIEWKQFVRGNREERTIERFVQVPRVRANRLVNGNQEDTIKVVRSRLMVISDWCPHPSGKVPSTWISCSSETTLGKTWRRPSIFLPKCINSATECCPSRIRSCSCDAIRAVASGWFNLTPLARRF